MRSPLSDGKPQREAAHDTNPDRRPTRHDRNAERNEQWTRSDHQPKTSQTRDATRQPHEHSADDGHHRRTAGRNQPTFASQLTAIGDDATGYGHVRHVIRRLGGGASPHRSFVWLAVCCLVAARAGSELASRSPAVYRGAAFADAVIGVRLVWWLFATGAVGATLISIVQQRRIGRLLILVIVVFAGHGAAQWHQLSTPRTGEFSGVATARSDAGNRGGAISLIVEINGENFRLTAYGRDRGALRQVRMGDTVVLDAQRVKYDARRLRFVAGRHVQGELQGVVVYATAPASALWHRAANRIHTLIDRGARTMQWQDAALVRGFVLGDESRHPRRMTEAFRGAGLGHLLAVSGQNVALILAALTPGLRRLSRWPRLSVALGVVVMFSLVTRLESSVVRAAVMAGVVQIGYAIGRDVAPLRALALTIIGIVAIDPLATWSVGFVLSVAATAGLVLITPHLGSSIFAATFAAQLGVSPFVLLWFGTMPVVALVTNLLAVPVASGVMMVAPILLGIAAFTPDAIAVLLTTPVVAAVRYVWWVAEWGTRLSPRGPINFVVWCGVGVLFARAVTPVRGCTRADLPHHRRRRAAHLGASQRSRERVGR